MLDTTKCVINNLNQFKYLKNRDRVHLKKIEVSDGESNNIRTTDGTLNRINYLETDNRVSNLHVFIKNYAKLRWRRFWFISLPAMLSVLSIASFFPPKRIPTTKELPAYEKVCTTYNSNYGEVEERSTGYVVDKGIGTYVLKDDKQALKNDSIKDTIRLQIYNEDDYINALIDINSKDLLSVNEIYTGDHYDFIDYTEMNFTDAGNNYDALYDKLVKLVKDSSWLSEDGLEMLENLNEDDKKTVIIEIEKYIDLGDIKVGVTKSKTLFKVIVIFMLVISGIVDIFYYDDKKEKAFEFVTLLHENGRLYEEYNRTVNLFFQAVKYKEAFLAAERERILLLNKEINENVASNESSKLLTGYEKKLIKRAKVEDARASMYMGKN